MSEQITLYTFTGSPYSHIVELALKEAELPYTHFEIDLQNKPSWFTEKINPAGQIPAISFGGPPVAPEEPSPESAKIAESAVILEFIADVSGKLLPNDAVLRAKARFIVNAAYTKLLPAFRAGMFAGESPECLLPILELIQTALPAEGKGRYAVGDEYSIADVVLGPFLARIEVLLKNDIGKYAEGLGVKTFAVLKEDPKFARYRQYSGELKERKVFKDTFDEEVSRVAFASSSYLAREKPTES